MILKEPGNFRIHRLRVIHLYEADYNLILSVKWRQIVHAAKDKRLLNPGEYGAVPNRRAQDPVFMEEMETEISRASRKPFVKFDNDATSCYDRILPSIASIVSQKYGAPKSLAYVFARTLEEAKYKLKTMLGISETSYKHSRLLPIYGTGQGSGNSPVIWLLISNELFQCYESKAHGATFESPDRTQRIQIFMVGFVDDTSCSVNLFHSNSPPAVSTLLDLMERDAQLWNDLLWSTGGALEPKKCSYHVVSWEFNDGIPQFVAGQVGRDLFTTPASGTPIQIQPLSAYSSHKTLGQRKEPSGNQTSQRKDLEKKCKKALIPRFLQPARQTNCMDILFFSFSAQRRISFIKLLFHPNSTKETPNQSYAFHFCKVWLQPNNMSRYAIWPLPIWRR